MPTTPEWRTSRAIRVLRKDCLRATAVLVLATVLVGAPSARGVGDRPTQAPRTLIAASFAPDSVLYRIHPRTGRATEIGPAGAELTDVAVRGTTLYAIGFNALYTVDTTSGAATFVGILGVSDANALTARPKSRALFGADQQGELLTINPHTGGTSVVGTFGHGLESSGDLAFLRTHLYATVARRGTTATLLARVNAHTGRATVIGRIGFHNVYGLIAAKGHLYGGTFGGATISISTKSGRGHRLSKTDVAIGGLTS